MNLNFGCVDAMIKFSALFDLNGTGHEQDWEYIFSDGEKLDIFVEAYKSLPLTPDEKITLMLLIVPSFNDTLTRHPTEVWEPSKSWQKIEKLISEDWGLHLPTVEYWACLEDEISNAFYCAPLMRSLLRQHASGI